MFAHSRPRSDEASKMSTHSDSAGGGTGPRAESAVYNNGLLCSLQRACDLLAFCSVLLPSSIRGLATPCTYFLHLSLSSVILIDSSTGSPVHVLMLSTQAVRGLPRLRAPGIVPCIIYFSRQLRCFLVV